VYYYSFVGPGPGLAVTKAAGQSRLLSFQPHRLLESPANLTLLCLSAFSPFSFSHQVQQVFPCEILEQRSSDDYHFYLISVYFSGFISIRSCWRDAGVQTK
jgi:hypothetical protein